MGEYSLVTDHRSTVFSLPRAYIANADSYREDSLMIFSGYLNYELRGESKLNPRWSYPGEPLFH